MNDEMDRDEVGELGDPGVALEPLEPVGTMELAVQDAQWLKPWQWLVGLVPVLWVTWQTVEVVRSSRGKGMVVPHRQARRMHFLQLLAVVGQAVVVFGPGWLTYVLAVLLAYQVFLFPSYPSPMKQLWEREQAPDPIEESNPFYKGRGLDGLKG